MKFVINKVHPEFVQWAKGLEVDFNYTIKKDALNSGYTEVHFISTLCTPSTPRGCWATIAEIDDEGYLL